jgi:hypothetical protein
VNGLTLSGLEKSNFVLLLTFAVVVFVFAAKEVRGCEAINALC